MTDSEQHVFYEDPVRELRARGVVCAITSGLACVHFGVAETTNDCDLLCYSDAFDVLLDILSRTQVDGKPCRYRDKISPPLDARWHRGGWTSHFSWGRGLDGVTLDVFGRAPRGSTRWEHELSGLYASPHVVAEMKRTHRDKDWAVITALGLKLIQGGDPRGWLHIFHHQTLLELLDAYPCPTEIVSLRPALELGSKRHKHTAGALNAERKLWEELDRLRIRIFERALRPYATAMRRNEISENVPLADQHQVRVRLASENLALGPLNDYGISRHIDEARQSLVDSGQVPLEALSWMPDVTGYFKVFNE